MAVSVLGGCARGPKPDPVVRAYYRDSLASLTIRCKDMLNAAYMSEKMLEKRTDFPGWEGYPVRLWEYTVMDFDSHEKKRGLVYTLNPSPNKLARWIVNAVFDATGSLDPAKIELLFNHIRINSGAQFPVCGVVYEATDTTGPFKPYIFKDGVTVYVADSAYLARDNHPDDAMLQYYLTLTYDQLLPESGVSARICSTTREMYYAAGGMAEVGYSDKGQRSLAWPAEVGRLYREAWKSDRNFLIYAWAKYAFE
jgi:hypothetical protein